MVKVHLILGGKNPHSNYLVGGAPCSINLDESNAINAERLAMAGRLFEEAPTFVEQVYLPDLLAVASFYKDWGAIGGGLSNYPAYGDLPTSGYADLIGLRDLIEAAVLTGPLPTAWLVTVSIDEIRPMTTEMSPAVAAAIPEIVGRVQALVAAQAAARRSLA